MIHHYVIMNTENNLYRRIKMERSFLFSKTLTAKKHYDVIVAGGGVAGVAAAVSAAK